MNFELETIKKVVDYIEENLNYELNLDKIAEKAGYSKFHLHRIFSKIVGETIHKYIQKRRLTEAARKLVYTDESIIDIALISGYESQQAFTLAFKKMYKSSPQMYRIKKNFEPKQLSIDIEEVFNYYENQYKSHENLYDNKIIRKNGPYKSDSLKMAA
ncbi:AraC family transcriptional regulator [Clostridium neonatale]|uniref:AraC family transcriptional regulator n=1 Tax=Clostridium neonatale TaxID=137838 RepID=UPI00291B8F97|nr:AraC family transcriptional regulator [Clostridium neonatale]CAI3206288.1 putative transcriptional regulator [Clostridium neonatale]CAI3213959.1 putative transcriptional regulator [Clostridium neonatale]